MHVCTMNRLSPLQEAPDFTVADRRIEPPLGEALRIFRFLLSNVAASKLLVSQHRW